MPRNPKMHTFQVYDDVPAIECRDGSLMSDHFAPTTNCDEYGGRWRSLDPTLWSHQSIEDPDDASTAHLMNLKRHISDLTNSANGHGSFSPTTMLGHEFSHLGLQYPFDAGSEHLHHLRYVSPSGPLGGSLSSTDSAPSECASSPDTTRYTVKPFCSHYSSQDMYSSSSYEGSSSFSNWMPQPLNPHNVIQSLSPYNSNNNNAACNMKDLQYTHDLDVDEDPLEDNDCIKVEVHGPEEIALSPATMSYRDEALGQSIRDDTSSFQDDDEDKYQESEADSDYNPQAPKRRNSNQVKFAGRRSPKRTRSINDTLLGDPKVKKSGQRKNSSRAPSSKPTKGASNTQKRVFTCAFHHYGCEATFGSKNEWKRHVGSQHLQLGFFRCDTGFCNPDAESSSAKSHPASVKSYNDFNRKDLFTQHHRRMHTPWSATSREPSAKMKQDFENSLEDVRKRCWHERRAPPRRSTCGFCRRVFEGPNGWDERMEHVGKHFEGKNNGATDVGSLHEEEDEDLREWALQEGIVRDYGTRGFWLVGMEPAEVSSAGRSSRRRGRPQQKDDEEDAEGENE